MLAIRGSRESSHSAPSVDHCVSQIWARSNRSRSDPRANGWMEVQIAVGRRCKAAEVATINRLMAEKSERYIVGPVREALEACLAAGPLPATRRPLAEYLRQCEA